MPPSEFVVANAQNRAGDGWDDPVHGKVTWRTLISADLAPTDSLSAGVAEIEPGCRLKLHRHSPSEIYFVVEGTGIVTVDGRDQTVVVGDAVFIPGDAEHGIRNESGRLLRFFYAFATDTFNEVAYRFPDAE